jgi:hypothetical protein
MGIFSWISDKNNKAPLNNGVVSTEKVLVFSKTYNELKPFYTLILHCLKYVFDSETEIRTKLKEIQDKTQQNLEEDEFMKEFLVLRYVSLYAWFFDINPPKNQEDLHNILLAINSALKCVLNDRNKLDYVKWLKDGFSDWIGVNGLDFKNLDDFKESFPNKLAERTTHILFNRTGGRMGGDLCDFITELIMTTLVKDRKVFNLDDDKNLSNEENNSIKDTIKKSKPTQQGFDNFLDSISSD